VRQERLTCLESHEEGETTMSGMSRRDLLRASAGAAAVAVPMSVLASHGAGASSVHHAAAGAAAAAGSLEASQHVDTYDVSGPVVFSVRDARAGEVSILHGDAEVIVHDRKLVDRILRAAQSVVA
jgi:hypothetical protein